MAISNDEHQQSIVDDCKRRFAAKQTMRNVFAQQWEEVAELVLPTSRNTFYYGSYNFPGQKKTDRQVDASAMMALERFAAIMDSLLTPRNMMWHSLESDNPYLNKQRGVRKYYEEATRILFKHRYHPRANFSAQNQNQYQGLGAFGTSSVFVDKYEGVDRGKGLRYKHLPLGETFLSENHQGLIDSMDRWFRLTPMQAIKQFPDRVPEAIEAAAKQNSQMPFEFLHCICPRDDYDEERWDERGKLYASYYICLTTGHFLREGGYSTFPIPTSRYVQTPGEVYGRGPAMLVLPAIKTLNSEKRDYLIAGHMTARPPLLTKDDGIVDFSFRSGALNKGGLDDEGRELVKPLAGAGNLQVTKEMMDEERSLIDGAFLVDLFKLLLNSDPKVFTATQVTEMIAQRGVLIAPTVGRQQSEYLGPLIERELDVLAMQNLLPPMPPVMREAQGEYHVVYTSPLARDMRAQEVAGGQRTIAMAIEIANATGDPSVFDRFDLDKMIDDSADIQGMPASWTVDDDAMNAKRKARADAQERQMQNQEKPADAAVLKAKAAAAKSGLAPGQLGALTGPTNRQAI
jgi:hypothetical protein